MEEEKSGAEGLNDNRQSIKNLCEHAKTCRFHKP